MILCNQTSATFMIPNIFFSIFSNGYHPGHLNNCNVIDITNFLFEIYNPGWNRISAIPWRDGTIIWIFTNSNFSIYHFFISVKKENRKKNLTSNLYFWSKIYLADDYALIILTCQLQLHTKENFQLVSHYIFSIFDWKLKHHHMCKHCIFYLCNKMEKYKAYLSELIVHLEIFGLYLFCIVEMILKIEGFYFCIFFFNATENSICNLLVCKFRVSNLLSFNCGVSWQNIGFPNKIKNKVNINMIILSSLFGQVQLYIELFWFC